MKQLEGDVWRTPTERVELVERLIRAEAKVKMLERTLREALSEPSEASYLLAQQARIIGLEANLERLVQQREAA